MKPRFAGCKAGTTAAVSMVLGSLIIAAPALVHGSQQGVPVSSSAGIGPLLTIGNLTGDTQKAPGVIPAGNGIDPIITGSRIGEVQIRRFQQRRLRFQQCGDCGLNPYPGD